jgi:hypothetical protein
MPIDCLLDRGGNRVVLTFEGPVEPGQVANVITRLIDGASWSLPCLCDLGTNCDQSSLHVLRALLDQASSAVSPRWRLPPVAIVVRNSALHDQAIRLLATLDTALVIEVFDDKDEAARWLADIVKVMA